MKRKTIATLGGVLAVALAAWWLWLARPTAPHDKDLEAALNGTADDFRKVIVLMDGADSLDEVTRTRCIAAGRQLFFQKQHALAQTGARLAGNSARIRQFVNYVSNDPSLHDADKLAFSDLVEDLEANTPASRFRWRSLSASLKALKDNLASIQLAYREEVTRIFSQFATRGAAPKREKWDAYVRYLRTLTSREKILAEFGDVSFAEPEGTRGGNPNEFFGNDFPAKTVALTFDDGPHPRYTEQVLALLRKYGLRASFFEIGVNLAAPHGIELSKKVLEAGHMVANHSYSHPVLTKLSGREARFGNRPHQRAARAGGRAQARAVPCSVRRAQQGDSRPGSV